MDNGSVLRQDQHCCSKCIGHSVCTQHAQISAWGEDKKERHFAQNCTWSGDTISNTKIQTFLRYLGTSKQQEWRVDLSMILEKTRCRTRKTTRRYQESEVTVIQVYAAGVDMWRQNLCAKDVDITSAKTNWVWFLLVTLARIRMKLMNLISSVVSPTILLLQTILSHVHSWIQKWILNITGIVIPYRVNDNYVIVTWGKFSDVKLLFFCKWTCILIWL